MRDPLEGLTADGVIRTGAHRDRVPPRYEPMLDAAVGRIRSIAPAASVYVYGSVATGAARPPGSDVDLLTIGLAADDALWIGAELSAGCVDLCRGVEIAPVTLADLDGDGDEAYGGRVFLHHYCVHLAGPDLDRSTSGFRGDRRAARGFNGDIGRCAHTWRGALGAVDPGELGRRVARKTLLAVTGLVSVHDGTWTTDREVATRRWQELHPELADGLDDLLTWSDGRDVATSSHLAVRLRTTVDAIVDQFTTSVGLWPD